MSDTLCDLFPRPKPVVAVLHVGPSPGVPGSRDIDAVVDRVVAETRLLVDLGVDGLLVENAYDEPALVGDDVGPEVVAFMTRVAAGVRRNAGRLPVGVRVLHSGQAGLAVAHGAGCDFVRVDGWAADPSAAARFHRYRGTIGSDLPALADLRPRDADEVEGLAEAVEAGRPDAILVLGPHPGELPLPGVVEAAREHTSLPLFCGGGLDADTLPDVLHIADGFLIGSGLKEQCRWQAPVSEPRVRAIIGVAEYARGQEVRQ